MVLPRPIGPRACFVALPTGVFVTDTTGRCVYANDAWIELSGLHSEATRGYGWIRSIHPDDVDDVRARWNAALDEEGALSGRVPDLGQRRASLGALRGAAPARRLRAARRIRRAP